MQTDPTPQEQHPLFYLYPEYWIGAIDVEYTKPPHGENEADCRGKVWSLSLELIPELPYLIPIFKPQHGEQFIKDLEQAVNSMFVSENIFRYEGEFGFGEYCFSRGDIRIYVGINDLHIRTTSLGMAFDTAAYARTLWKLGYYL